MKKGRMALALIVGVLAVCVTGCSAQTDNNGNEMNEIQNEDIDESETEITEQDEEPIELQTESFFYDARSFHCQRAWVQKEQNGAWSCIDISGKEVFSLEEGQVPFTDFQNGIAVVDNEMIIDVDGNIISSVNDGMYTEIMNGYECDGYVFVKVYKNTIDETSTKTGILDCNGTWWLEPVYISSIDSYGHGIYGFWQENGEVYYDLYSNEYIDRDDRLELLLQRSYADNDLIFIEKVGDHNHFDGDANLSFDIVNDLGFNTDVTGFYNRNKELVIDMSQYAVATAESEFINGYCAMTLQNNQGGIFVAIIDEKGEYMFDPISFGDNHWIYNGFSKGLLCYRKGGDRDFNYMDIHGQTKLEEILPADDCEFDEEGFLRVLGLEDKKPNTIAFINTDGEIAF